MKKIIMILALLSVFSLAMFAENNGSSNAPERTEGKWTELSYVNVPILKILEGKDGYGIGEWIEYDISEFLKRREDVVNRNANLYILNGYVNPKLPYLYKENSRIKKATLIIDDSTEIKIEFDDIVEFKCVELGRPFTKVRLIIDEVYKGTKYDDTCITAITVDWEYN
jgi:hypothetical protein